MGFWRTREDFRCTLCGTSVQGDGYTNHCPACLASLHVDVEPGDRLEDCQGIMDPVALERKGETMVIVHRCRECGLVRRCRTSTADDPDALLALARRGPRLNHPSRGRDKGDGR